MPAVSRPAVGSVQRRFLSRSLAPVTCALRDFNTDLCPVTTDFHALPRSAPPSFDRRCPGVRLRLSGELDSGAPFRQRADVGFDCGDIAKPWSFPPKFAAALLLLRVLRGLCGRLKPVVNLLHGHSRRVL